MICGWMNGLVVVRGSFRERMKHNFTITPTTSSHLPEFASLAHHFGHGPGRGPGAILGDDHGDISSWRDGARDVAAGLGAVGMRMPS